MKKFKNLLLILLLIPLTLCISGCSLIESTPSVTSIEKTDSIGTTDIYTITYSNGTTSTFTIENGKDGKDSEFSLDTIKAYCEEKGITLEEFFRDYASIDLSENNIKSATNNALQSAVSIYVEHPIEADYQNTSPALFMGSGVIYELGETYSYIITNYHVVHYENSLNESKVSEEIHIYQYGMDDRVTKKEVSSTEIDYIHTENAVKCDFVGGTDKYDIAILKCLTSDLKANNPNVKAVEVTTEYSISEDIVAVGNPLGYGMSATQGIISVESETISLYNDNYHYSNHRVMRIDAAVNGGNSGGGLFNSNGKLIGIVNAKTARSDVDNMAYAIPAVIATRIADNVIFNHTSSNQVSNAKQCLFGITYKTENYKTSYNNTTGIIETFDQGKVDSVGTDSLAEGLGFKAGDLFKSVKIKRNSTITTYELKHAHEFADLTLYLRAGDGISVVVDRNGTDVTLGDCEKNIIKSTNLVECDKTDYIYTKIN